MASTSPDSKSAARRGSRSAYALPLSIAIHAVVIVAVSRVPWAASEMAPPSPILSVWLQTMRTPQPRAPEATESPDERVPELVPEELAPAERPPEPPPEKPAPQPEPAPAVAAPSEAPPPQAERAPRPDIDWDEERRRAVRGVIENQEHERGYRTFSPDDIAPKKREPDVEPAPPPMVVDDCVITTSKVKRMMMMMIGRCVRGPRGDLFADIKPFYLKARPVCAETRPEAPGAVTSTGEVISTVKCELVVDQEQD